MASVMTAEALEFESTLAEVTARLLAAPGDGFETELDHAIERLALFFGADRGSILLFEDDGTTNVVAAFAGPTLLTVPKGPTQLLPNWAGQARRGLGFTMHRPDEIPESWTEERAFVAANGIQSNLMFPLRIGEKPIGLLSLSSLTRGRDWSASFLTRFRLFGEILASAIVRARAERDLRASLAEISKLKERADAENVVLREEVRDAQGFDEIVGRSPALMQVLYMVEQVAPTGSAVLLTGETGTGKELLARAIHRRSSREGRPFVAVNCAALPGTLIESELFGYERGAFTGALQRRLGRFEVATGGTIFLDEISDIPADIQGRLLRVLQEGTFERLGSSHTIRTDVRVVAATNRDLEAAVAEGRWRADLFYRLKVFPIEVPPLRHRREDIPLLVWYFVTRKRTSLGRAVTRIPDKAMSAFQRYDWPGNVRELENVIERALILSPGDTLVVDERTFAVPSKTRAESGIWSLEDVERGHILKVLGECGWRIAGRGNAAERLGMNRSTLRSRMEKLGIERPQA
ncbi:MAG TPA: sigma 54-interacting transcriptional regulator [Thermoanaerobaculia bacterium]|nr:sigma 54-interacting transcriptional regulator [Thermoanaerobaculia bacterium]